MRDSGNLRGKFLNEIAGLARRAVRASTGGNVLKVQAYLGWSSSSLIPLLSRVQQGYTHLRVEDLREISELVDKIYYR